MCCFAFCMVSTRTFLYERGICSQKTSVMLESELSLVTFCSILFAALLFHCNYCCSFGVLVTKLKKKSIINHHPISSLVYLFAVSLSMTTITESPCEWNGYEKWDHSVITVIQLRVFMHKKCATEI